MGQKPRRQRSGVRLDAVQAAHLSEVILKETRAQQKFLQQQAALGNLFINPLDKKAETPSVKEDVNPLPSLPQEDSVTTLLSRYLWSSVNPGYHVPTGETMCSTTKADFTCDTQQVANNCSESAGVKTFNRRRNDVSEYMEQTVKFKNILKSK
eukprot:jgi/Botrbrau1/23397/Bobra.0051s0043.1